MCGLSGIVDLRGERPVSRELITLVNDTMVHRGPDGKGIHLENGCALGHRRLAIIDLEGGAQPLYNEDGNVVVVYNGEIYNFQELATELETLGHTFRTRCDTEVIVHAWEQWGENCLQRFRGMFAFALWDKRTETLFLARDRLGIKPLFFSVTDSGWCVVASELKALLVHPELSRALDPQATEEYLAFGYIPEPKTIYRNVKKLLPGHYIVARRGAQDLVQKQYWDVDFSQRAAGSFEEWREEMVARLEDAIKVRLIAEVPIGAFLSGGIDSSAVVALMAGLMDSPVNTCSISFDDKRYDETEYASMVAQRYATNHFVERADTDDYDLLSVLNRLYDEPFADSSAIPTYRVCQIARERVTVALSGDGGDENYGGYRRYLWFLLEERFRRLLPRPLRQPVFGLAGRIYPKMDWAPKYLRAKSTLQAVARDSVEGYFHGVSITTPQVRQSIYSSAMQSDLQGYHAVEVFRNYAKACQSQDPLTMVQYLDIKTYLPGDILTKVDRASMAHSLEVRVPFLDHPLVEWAASLPSNVKIKSRECKYILKKAMEPHLPHDVLYRRKMGFAVPLASWLRGPLRKQVDQRILGERMLDCGMFSPDALQGVIRSHQDGLRDHSSLIWALLMYDEFLKNSAGSGVVPTSAVQAG